MKNILTLKQAISISKKLKKRQKTIVLTGGCFDVIHIGHIKFLQKSKKYADFLFVLLENDQSVRKLKGENRPINNQKNRAIVLSCLKPVDYVVLLPDILSNSDYDRLVEKINPQYLCATKNDPNIVHKKRQAEQINAKVIFATEKISDQSTTKIAKIIENLDL